MTLPDLIARLRTFRSETGLTGAELADLAGTSQPNVARFFSGRADVRVSTLLKMCSALAVRIDLVPDKLPATYQTFCCQSEPVRHGRADMRCGSCGKDVTLEMVLWDQVVNPDQVQNDI